MTLHIRARKPAVDLDALLELVGGDCELFREVAELGADDLVRLVAAIDGATTVLEMVEFAHELKGVLLNLTATSAAKWARAVEQAARSGDEAAARAELSRGRATICEVAATLGSVAAHAKLRVAS